MQSGVDLFSRPPSTRDYAGENEDENEVDRNGTERRGQFRPYEPISFDRPVAWLAIRCITNEEGKTGHYRDDDAT